MRGFLVFFLALTVLPVCAWADEKKGVESAMQDVKVVTTEGRAFIDEDMTMSQAKAVALNYARRSALEKAVGVNLHSNTLLYNGEIISELINSATKGLIIKEKVEGGCGEESGGRLYCYARIEAHVKPLKGENAPRIKFLKSIIQRPDKEAVVNNPVFQNNDEIQIRVTLNGDSYQNVFSVDQYGNITKLFPNDYAESKPVTARKEFVFPDDSLRARGLKLRVTTPENRSKATETVLIVATKEKEYFLEDGSTDNPTIADLMRELSELDQSQWAEKTIGYEVRR